MRTLNLDDKNVSDKALQSAQATLLGDEASYLTGAAYSIDAGVLAGP